VHCSSDIRLPIMQSPPGLDDNISGKSRISIPAAVELMSSTHREQVSVAGVLTGWDTIDSGSISLTQLVDVVRKLSSINRMYQKIAIVVAIVLVIALWCVFGVVVLGIQVTKEFKVDHGNGRSHALSTTSGELVLTGEYREPVSLDRVYDLKFEQLALLSSFDIVYRRPDTHVSEQQHLIIIGFTKFPGRDRLELYTSRGYTLALGVDVAGVGTQILQFPNGTTVDLKAPVAGRRLMGNGNGNNGNGNGGGNGNNGNGNGNGGNNREPAMSCSARAPVPACTGYCQGNWQ